MCHKLRAWLHFDFDSAELNERFLHQRRCLRAAAAAAAAAMGQQLSGQAVVSHLPEKLVKHIGLVRDSGYLTYEEFLARVAELNDVWVLNHCGAAQINK